MVTLDHRCLPAWLGRAVLSSFGVELRDCCAQKTPRTLGRSVEGCARGVDLRGRQPARRGTTTRIVCTFVSVDQRTPGVMHFGTTSRIVGHGLASRDSTHLERRVVAPPYGAFEPERSPSAGVTAPGNPFLTCEGRISRG